MVLSAVISCLDMNRRGLVDLYIYREDMGGEGKSKRDGGRRR